MEFPGKTIRFTHTLGFQILAGANLVSFSFGYQPRILEAGTWTMRYSTKDLQDLLEYMGDLAGGACVFLPSTME